MGRIYLILFLVGAGITQACSSKESSDIPIQSILFEVKEQFDSVIPGFEGYLGRPTSFDVDAEGHLYVLDEVDAHIVVLDEDLVVIKIIGSKGQGPGEIQPFRQGNRYKMAVGGGYVVVCDGPRTINVFTVNGEFVNRFSTVFSLRNIAVRDDGVIVGTTLETQHPLVEYDLEGNIVGEYGRAFLNVDEEVLVKVFRSRILNDAELGLLNQNIVVAFNSYWLRLRSYHNYEEISEGVIDMMELCIGADKENRNAIYKSAQEVEKRSPERFNDLIPSGRISDEDLPFGRLVLSFTTNGDDIWIKGGKYLYQMNISGEIKFAIETNLQGSSGYLAVHGNTIYFCDPDNATIATATLPGS